MLEFLICALFTIVPDYLIKRFVYKKRWGKELTFMSMWYELRWGITACLILTISLITLIFFYHPSTTNVTAVFRTLTILPDTSGRVAEVFVENNQFVKRDDPLFSLESSSQEAAVETARSKLEEVEAEFVAAEADLKEAEGAVSTAKAQLKQAKDDLRRKVEIAAKGGDLISEREVELSENQVLALESELVSAMARRDEVLANIKSVLPAKLETAEDTLKQAIVELEETVVHADVTGRVTQLVLQPGDIVNPLLRPAGLLIPEGYVSGRQAVQAGFHQLAAPVIKPGTLAEITCFSKPFTIVPMVVTAVQPTIAAGQLRPTDQLVDLQDRAKPGTLTVRLEPLWENGLDGVVPGTKCVANAYTNNHERIASGELGTAASLYYHMVDTVGIVHALILRIQALMIPVQHLVFAGH
jgi:multidrug resistance efflux pump